jgi:glycosyltransferase involved in cell wall biosynthesis
VKIGFITFVDVSKLRADAVHTASLLKEFRRLKLDVAVLAGPTEAARGKSRFLTFLGMVFGRLALLARVAASRRKFDLFYVRDWLFACMMSFFGLRYAFEINGLILYEGLIRRYYRRGSLAYRFFRRLEKRVLKSATRIVAVSSGMKDYCTTLGVGADKVLVAENAADPDVFNPDRPRVDVPARKDAVLAGWMGSFESHHGFQDLVCIAQEMQTKGCAGVQFLIIGGGRRQTELQQRIVAQGLQEYFVFCGAVSWDQVPAYMLNADFCLCLDSRTDENLEYRNVIGVTQIKVFEYLALGKPVLAQDLGDARDFFESRRIGWVCACEPAEVARRIIEIAGHREQIAECSKNALAVSRETYNWPATARKIVGFLRESVPPSARGVEESV